jgi:Associated with zinc fingers
MDEEVEWQTPKRRKTAAPGRLVSPETKTINMASENPFTPLASRSFGGCDQEKSPKTERPPPIFIKNVTNINALLKNITGVNPGEFSHSTTNNNLKLVIKTVEGYRNTIKYLESTTAEYHTFQLKSEKAFRVVIRGLHPSCDTGLMMEELRDLGFEPIQMLPVRHPVTKQLLPMFFLDLKPAVKNIEIYNMKKLYHAIIKVEPPKPRRTVIQCTRCQDYNHTKHFCHQRPRCVKCDGMHPSEKCPKPSDTPPVCVNCKGPHTANYRGCPVHKNLQLSHPHLKFLNNKRQTETKTPYPHATPEPAPAASSTSARIHPKPRTYAEATRTQDTPSLSAPSPTSNLLEKIDSLIAILQPLIGMLTQILPVLLHK